jgi:hypothetical protein
MVDGRVVERPRGGHRFLKLKLWLSWWNVLTGERAGPLGEKWRPLVRKVKEWYVESRHLQG